MIVIGIDPGLKGALCLVKDNIVRQVKVMPTYKVGKETLIDLAQVKSWFKSMMKIHKIDGIYIEKQIVVSKQGLKSSGKTMYQFGLIVGLLMGLGITPTIVRAIDWQKKVFARVDLTKLSSYNYPETKLKSIGFVEQNYGLSYLFTSKRQKKPSDGIADAICIAIYGSQDLAETRKNVTT